MMQRVRRTRTPDVVESTPLRVRRVRPVVEAAVPARVTRVRRTVVIDSYRDDPRPRFVIDWGKSLGWKLQIYLVTSYLYYHLSKSVITDHEFDRLCNELNAGWDTFEHQHKHCTSREDMIAGTGYANKYPNMVKGAADCILRAFHEV